MANQGKMKEEKINSQLKLFIQKTLQNISMDLLNLDEERTYTVNKKDLEKVLRFRVKLPEFLKQDHQRLTNLVEEYA